MRIRSLTMPVIMAMDDFEETGHNWCFSFFDLNSKLGDLKALSGGLIVGYVWFG